MSTAAVLYPWGDIVHRRTGASLRTGQMIDHLARRWDRVIVLSPSECEARVVGNVEYRFVSHGEIGPPPPRPRESRRYRLAQLARRLSSRAAVDSPLDALEFFRRFAYGGAITAHLTALLDETDVAFLEYPFWARAVVPLARERDVPVVLTMHDVLSRTFEAAEPDDQARLLEEELWALRSADHAVCVAGADQAFFAGHGAASGCIPNPVDVSRCQLEPRDDVLEEVRARLGLGDGPFCLFFGSLHPPNNEAAALLEHLAPQVPDATFVIAGTCAAPGRDGNVVKVGEVSDEDRRSLYTLASLVTIPLQRGTGSSLKLVEALAHGRAVLATTVGARGYAVDDGVHAIVSDTLTAWPALIGALLANAERRAGLAAEGRLLARRYDFRTAFTDYDDLVAPPELAGRPS